MWVGRDFEIDSFVVCMYNKITVFFNCMLHKQFILKGLFYFSGRKWKMTGYGTHT